ncbi:integrin beta-PS-like [Hyposmocoma kahamanoa]|uniref:integrin beta-PS-like n=1 Tax=Hyposmocoma kahamanoa TaxID=1477025 RepID=UPI000E6D6B8F|nr:integrin beta-PS-like [Hyposmocoma kahamanoa]
MRILVSILLIFCAELCLSQHPKLITPIDEKFVCIVKKNCEHCLRLPLCSWCPTENKCFSQTLDADFCKDNSIGHEDLGLSLEENASCLCRGDKYVNTTTCFPPREDGDTIPSDEPACSDRGKCICGRCFCDLVADPEHPTKLVMGDHCEFDNFSCQDECNEGPYLINPHVANTETKTLVDDSDKIEEM